MNKPRIMVSFGTRPDAIKMASVVHAARRSSRFETLVCATGQHREMLDAVTSLFEIDVDHNLSVMEPGQQLNSLTARIIMGMAPILAETRPAVVLVHGDTTTALGVALAAYYAKIPVAHVEAGLRTHDIYSPWPEEMNRKLVGAIAQLHFAPTDQARRNLLGEGVPDGQIAVTGNTVIDSLLWMVKRLDSGDPALDKAHSQVERIVDPSRKLVVVTGHRRENFGEGFARICEALKQIAMTTGAQVVYPVHLNPDVRKPVMEALGGIPNLVLCEPLDYAAFVALLKRCDIVLTDSGGVQEEAPTLGKPVLVMRDRTERPEALAAKSILLVGTRVETIVGEVRRLLSDRSHRESMSRVKNPFGDGTAAQQIVSVLERHYAN